MSELLRRLDRDLRDASDPLHRVVLLSKKGLYLARTGEFEATRGIIGDLRSVFGSGTSARATARIMLTEGILHLYESMSSKALERVAGAQALAIAARDSSLIAVSSAWKAHVEFEMSRFDSMHESIRTAMQYASEIDHDAHARLAMVLCSSFFLVGDRRSAQTWFVKSHDSAQVEGDQAGIEALLYNRAALWFAWLRAKRCMSKLPSEQISLARLEISSATNLQNLTRIKALTNLVHLCSARLFILEERFEQAIDALQSVRDARPFADWNFCKSLVDMEIAYCLFALGSHSDALDRLSLVDVSAIERLDVDERLVSAWMRREMCRFDRRYGDLSAAEAQFDLHARQYSESVEKLKELLVPFAVRND